MNLDLKLLIEKPFPDIPLSGVRQVTWPLQNEGHAVIEKRIRRLMRLMRLMPIFQKPDTSRPAKGHEAYPHLLGRLRVEQPNQGPPRGLGRRHHPCLGKTVHRAFF